MSEGDLSSWIVAGAFASKPGGAHKYNMGLSYSTQDYQGGNPAALAAVTDGSRNVGELYAFDRWTRQPASHARLRRALRALRLSPGARPAQPALWRRGRSAPQDHDSRDDRAADGRAGRGGIPGDQHARARGCRRSGRSRRCAIRPRSTRSARSGPDRSRLRSSASSPTRSRWRSAGSISRSTISWSRSSACGCPAARDRSATTTWRARAAVEADGWRCAWNTPANRRVQGSVQYSRTAARWAEPQRHASCWADWSRRCSGPTPRISTTSRPRITADIRETATRVFVLYKMNNGFVGSASGPARRRARRPVRHPGESGASRRVRGHEVGSARGPAQPLPRPHRSGVGVRRTARRPPAQAAGRRLPRPILIALSRLASRNSVARTKPSRNLRVFESRLRQVGTSSRSSEQKRLYNKDLG